MPSSLGVSALGTTGLAACVWLCLSALVCPFGNELFEPSHAPYLTLQTDRRCAESLRCGQHPEG